MFVGFNSKRNNNDATIRSTYLSSSSSTTSIPRPQIRTNIGENEANLLWVGYGLGMGWAWVGHGLVMGWVWVGYGLDMSMGMGWA